jgi:hypothetical protein
MTNGVKQPPGLTQSEKDRLTGLAQHAHDALRMLRMGEQATISCSRQYPMDEVRGYIYGYAFHKKKWFDIKTNKVANALVVTRTEKPKPIKHFDGEEVE